MTPTPHFVATVNDSATNGTYADLEAANDAMAVSLSPAMVVVAIFMVMGIVGNSLVCYVFCLRMHASTQNYLIVYLAVFDLLSCTVGMPTEIADMRNYLMFDSELACKIMRFINSFCAIGSVWTLVAIAVDRFRKVCRPFKGQLNVRHVKILILPILGVALFFAWPALVMYGLRTIDSGVPGLPGTDCSTPDGVKDTIYPLLYNMALFTSFVALAVALLLIYCQVLREVQRHNRYMKRTSNFNLPSSSSSQSQGDVTYTSGDQSRSCYYPVSNVTCTASRGSKTLDIKVNPLDIDNKQSIMYSVHGEGQVDNGTTGNTTNRENGSPVTGVHQQRALEQKRVKKKLSFNFDGGVVINGLKSNGLGTCACGEEPAESDMLNKSSIPNKTFQEDTREKPTEVDLQCSVEYESGPIPINVNTTCDITPSEEVTSQAEDTHHNSVHATEIRTLSSSDEVTSYTEDTHHNTVCPTQMKTRSPSETALLQNDNVETSPDLQNFCKDVEDTSFNNSTRLEHGSQMFVIKPGDAQSIGESKTKQKRKKSVRSKTTVIAFVVTLVFILSFLPHLCLQISKLVVKGYDYNLTGVRLVLYNIFLRSYFINSVSNPIIYSYLNIRFKQEIKYLASQIKGLCKKTK